MPDAALGRARLVAQGLVTRPFATALHAVSSHGAMQGQDLPGVIASTALRLSPSVADPVATVLAEMDAGRIVRGYPMRGTVFLMAADDLAWVSELCNGGAVRAAEKRRGSLDLTDVMVDRARDVAVAALGAAERGLPRAELFERWAAVGTSTEGGRGYHVLTHLISTGVVCYGPWNGSDQNVVLSSTWLPAGSDLAGRFNGDRVAAVAELLRRYLTSHGPATIRDFAWWTKLPLGEIRTALALVSGEVESSDDPEPRYWRAGLLDEVAVAGKEASRPMLLPGFDEFILGYADRLFAMTPDEHALLVPGNNGVFGKSAVVDGTVRGLWKRGGRPGKRKLDLTPFGRLSQTNQKTFDRLFESFPFVTA